MNKQTMESPVGTLTLVERDGVLAGIYFEDHKPAPRDLDAIPIASTPVLRAAEAMLADYFRRPNLRANVTLPSAGTPMQREVWEALMAIEPSQTISYAELARRVGRPRAVRAVAQAVARNPLSIVVPCHRVVGSDGSTTGYAGGVARKEWLLAHEAVARR